MPPDPKEPKSPLEVFAEVADKIAAKHSDHPRSECGQSDLAANVARICREEPDRVTVVNEMEDEEDGLRTGLLFVQGPVSGDGSGPAVKHSVAAGRAYSRAATPAYRDGWETIFGKRVPVGQS